MEPKPGSEVGNAWAVAIQIYLDLYSVVRHVDSTRKRVERVLKPFTRWLAGRGPTLNDIESYLFGRVKAGLSPATANLELRTIRAFARWAIARGNLTVDPTEGLKPLDHRRRGRVATPEEVSGLLSWLDAQKRQNTADLVRVIVNTGLRICEALNLRCCDIDPMARRLKVTPREDWAPKDKEPRIVPLNDVAYQVLLRRIINRTSGYVWETRTGKPIGYRNAFRDLEKAAAGAGVERANFQGLRSLFATVAAKTMTPYHLGFVLGHSTAYVTDRHYLHPELMEITMPHVAS